MHTVRIWEVRGFTHAGKVVIDSVDNVGRAVQPSEGS